MSEEKSKREAITMDTRLTNEIQLHDSLIGWYRPSKFYWMTINEFLSRSDTVNSGTFRYVDEPDREFHHVKPIELVTPTKQDIIDCIKATGDWPKVEICDDNGKRYGAKLHLIITGDSYKFWYHYLDNTTAYCSSYCRMDKSLREGWAG